MKLPVLYIIIPCYNEEEVLPITAPMFLEELQILISRRKIHPKSKIMLVNDGSKDQTWEIINDLALKDNHFCGIAQSRNRGHQNALLAGLFEAKELCDIVISIDCDGQDDIGAMEKMIEEYCAGNDIVYAVRDDRSSDSSFKRVTAQLFYKLLNTMGVEVVYNHADYRLMSQRALRAFFELGEVNLFLRGMVPLIGFPSSVVYYKRTPRLAGESHYPLKKMIALAIDGITSLSVKPLRFITVLGVSVSVLSFICVIWALVQYLIGNTVSGWASITCIFCFFSGVQLISLGVVGEYIGKIFLEVKHRPRFIISERTQEKLIQMSAADDIDTEVKV